MGEKRPETRCKGEIMGSAPPGGTQGMRYYPAFDVKSWLDTRFRRYLSSAIKVLPLFASPFNRTDQS
jgi:hypothetical protein